MGVSDTLSRFAMETSIHGLAYVAQTSSSKEKRVAWMCLFIGSVIYAFIQIKYLAQCKFTCYTMFSGYDHLHYYSRLTLVFAHYSPSWFSLECQPNNNDSRYNELSYRRGCFSDSYSLPGELQSPKVRSFDSSPGLHEKTMQCIWVGQLSFVWIWICLQ